MPSGLSQAKMRAMPANFAFIAKVIAASTATPVGPNVERTPYATVERMLGHKLSAESKARFKTEWEAACDNWFVAHSPPSVARATVVMRKKRRSR